MLPLWEDRLEEVLMLSISLPLLNSSMSCRRMLSCVPCCSAAVDTLRLLCSLCREPASEFWYISSSALSSG